MKKFLITVAFVAAFAIAGSASAATYVYSGGLLKVGSQGTQVYNLQACLAELGNNPDSNIDGAFGPITRAAVMSFQAANGVMVDGIIGPVTGPLYTAACADDASDSSDSSATYADGCTATSTYSSTTGEACDAETSDSSDVSGFDVNNGDEANITGVDIDDASDTTIDEGSSKAELASIDFKNEDSDVLLERFDIILVSDLEDTLDEKDAWKTFDKLYIYVDGDMVDSMVSDDKSDWDDRTVAFNGEDKDNRFRFTGLNTVLDKDEDHNITVKADIASSVDMNANGAQWTLVFEDTTARFVDEAGITQYLTQDGDGSSEVTASFAIVSEGDQDELQVKSSNDDPDATTFEVKSGQESDEEMLFAFEVEADQDGGDLEISEMTLSLTMGTEAFDTVISEVTVVIAGESEDYDVSRSTISAALGGTSSLVFDFNGKEINIDAGDTETAEVYVTFKSTNNQTAYVNGETVQLSVTSTDVDAWDVDGGDTLGAARLTGSATGDVHQLSEEGVIATLNSSSVSTTIDNNGEVKSATYTMNVELEAFGNTFYTSKTAIIGAIVGDEALSFDVEDSADVIQTTLGVPSLVSFALSSSASTDGTAWRIDEGETETITLTATVEIPTLGADTYTRLQLNEVGVWTDNALTANGQVINLLPVEDYESALQLINNI